MKRAILNSTPKIGFENTDPVFSQIFNVVNQQPHYSAESLKSEKPCEKGFSQLPKIDPPCKSIFEQSKRDALENIAKDRLSTVGRNPKHAKIQQQAPTTHNLEGLIPRLAARPTDTSTSGGANGRQPLCDKLAKIMTCTTCKRIVRPGLIFRCIDGHVYCERCKGGSLAEFGRFCTSCKDVYKKKHKIRPNKALRETNPHIQEADKYIEKCYICSHTYYNLGNGKKEHLSLHIDQTWHTLRI
jgi:hypothetical protein